VSEPSPIGALNQLYAELTADLTTMARQIDERFRRQHEGMPATEIVDAAEHAYADIGLHLSDDQLDAYAAAVSERRPFEFILESDTRG
jgi:hypothetical protein